jgi:ribosomal protein S27AE
MLMSNIYELQYEKEGYFLLSENKEAAFTKCVNCYETNFFGIKDKSFKCSKCGVVQTT